MKVVAFNPNSIRMREHQLEPIIQKYASDVIGIQETKAQNSDFPLDMIASPGKNAGYQAAFHAQKTHYSVTFLYKNAPLQISKSFSQDSANAQRRFISATFEVNRQIITVMNSYFLQRDSNSLPQKYPAKKKYYASLTPLIETQTTARSELNLSCNFYG